jgi:hypothetical protein
MLLRNVTQFLLHTASRPEDSAVPVSPLISKHILCLFNLWSCNQWTGPTNSFVTHTFHDMHVTARSQADITPRIATCGPLPNATERGSRCGCTTRLTSGVGESVQDGTVMRECDNVTRQ